MIITKDIGSSDSPILFVVTYSNFNWQNVTFTIYDDAPLKSTIPGFEEIWVKFKTPIKKKWNDDEATEELKANFYIPSDKVEELQAAFLSLRTMPLNNEQTNTEIG